MISVKHTPTAVSFVRPANLCSLYLFSISVTLPPMRSECNAGLGEDQTMKETVGTALCTASNSKQLGCCRMANLQVRGSRGFASCKHVCLVPWWSQEAGINWVAAKWPTSGCNDYQRK
eukprot:1158843-Pelagomonas_calceolata.AAC.12